MKKSALLIMGVATAVSLGGCQTLPQNSSCSTVTTCSAATVAPPVVAQQPEQRIKITGIGFGAESTFSAYTPGQRRLMAIRASKLDAYRALAEQLYGIKIDSNTAISTMTAKNDSFRARVNAVVRGARVVSVTPMADQNYETVLEVYVDKGFFENAFVYRASAAAITPEEACVNCQDASSY